MLIADRTCQLLAWQPFRTRPLRRYVMLNRRRAERSREQPLQLLDTAFWKVMQYPAFFVPSHAVFAEKTL